MIIPTTEIYNFDEQTYLEANPEVETLIKNNELKDTLEHLQTGGQEEIGRGTRKFHQDFPPFDETRYLQTFKSIREAVENGVFASGFDHFCQFGYEEILRGKRLWPVLQEARTIQKVIVIVGIPRSGLTLTEALLGSHSQVTPWFLPYATRKNQGIKPFTDSDSIQRAYAEAFHGDKIGTNTVAISASTTGESIDFLTQSLENLEKNGIEVKIIWMVRNINHTYLSQMEAAARYWNGPEDNIKTESYQQYISFAQKNYDKIVALVKYYDHVIHSFSALLKEPDSIMHKIQDFVQIPAEDSQDFHSRINLKRVAGDPGFLAYDTVLKLKDRERQQQWEEYDHFIQSLDASLQFFVDDYNLLTARAKKEPLVHYLEIGKAKGLEPFVKYRRTENRFHNAIEKNEYDELNKDGFDVEFYKNNNKDLKIKDTDFDYLLHFIRQGKFEGREILLSKKIIKFDNYGTKNTTKKRILFISNTARVERPYLDPSVRYRCYNAAMAINKNKFIVDVISFNKFMLEHVYLYDCFVFHRPPDSEKLYNALDKIKNTKKQFLADYDDLIFSPKYALESSIFKTGRASEEECMRIFENNKKGMLQFTDFIVSTDTLKEKILELKPNAKVSVIHNALSETFVNLQKIKDTGLSYFKTKKKIITYLSGTKSHDTDFKIIEDVLYNLYQKNKDKMIFQVVGPLEYDKKKLHFIKHLQYVPYEQLSDIVKKSHINIAPLEMNSFTQCKSGLKFFESGIYGIPSIVTPIPDMLRFEKSGGISFATNSDEWEYCLNELINNETYYQEKSKKTKDYVMNHCLIQNEIYKYEKLFEETT